MQFRQKRLPVEKIIEKLYFLFDYRLILLYGWIVHIVGLFISMRIFY